MSEVNVPDSISFSNLKELLEDAPSEEVQATNEDKGILIDGKTPDQVMDIAHDIVTDALSKVGDPIIHKAMVVTILNKLVEWHTSIGQDHSKDDLNCSTAWLRDAGKLQACMNILMTISLGGEDFLFTGSEDNQSSD